MIKRLVIGVVGLAFVAAVAQSEGAAVYGMHGDGLGGVSRILLLPGVDHEMMGAFHSTCEEVNLEVFIADGGAVFC